MLESLGKRFHILAKMYEINFFSSVFSDDMFNKVGTICFNMQRYSK